MYKENDIVVYRKDVCKIIGIKKINELDYYIMNKLDDSSLTITIPINSNLIRKVITKKEAENIINQIPNIKPLKNIDDKYMESKYKELLHNGSYEDLITIIKSAYLRNSNRIKNSKRVSERDTKYFDLAEKYLYTELSIALDITIDETQNYIINKVEQLINN